MRNFAIKIVFFLLITQTAFAQIVPAQLRNKLMEAYRIYVKKTLNLGDPLPEKEKWRFPTQNVLVLSSDESFALVVKIYELLKRPVLKQQAFDNLLKSGVLAKGLSATGIFVDDVQKRIAAFINLAGATSVSSLQNKNKNYQFVLQYAVTKPAETGPVKPVIPSAKKSPTTAPVKAAPVTPVPIAIPPGLNNKESTLVKGIASLANQNYLTWLQQGWRFDEPGAIKIASNDSFSIMARANNNKSLSQSEFSSFMKALSTETALTQSQTALRNNLYNLVKTLPINRISAFLVNKNWQLRFYLGPPSAIAPTKPPIAPLPGVPVGAPSAKGVKPPLPVKEAEKPLGAWIVSAMDNGAHYYLKAYEDAPYEYIERTIPGQQKTIRVNRPDHGLAHAIRKTALAIDLLDYVTKNQGPPDLFSAITQLRQDIMNFDALFQLAAFLLRTGRQSESPSKEQYRNYIFNSANNLASEAKKYPQLFKSENIDDFVIAIKATADKITLNDKQRWISQLLNAVHDLDLLRITSFDGGKTLDINRLKESLAHDLATKATDPLLAVLLDNSGKYLDATGDINVPKNKLSRTDDFFIQSQSPALIITAIKKAGGFRNF